jgi:hypothetical protein
MRLILLRGAATVLALLTAVAVLALPLWMFSAAAGSMLAPGIDPWAFPLLVSAPYILLGTTWFCLWLVARITRPKRPA